MILYIFYIDAHNRYIKFINLDFTIFPILIFGDKYEKAPQS